MIAQEHPELRATLVDLARAAARNRRHRRSPSCSSPRRTSPAWALRGDARPTWRELARRPMAALAGARSAGAAAADELRLRPDGAYLITGGLGALGLQVARWMVERGATAARTSLGRRGGSPSRRRPRCAVAEASRAAASRPMRADVADATRRSRRVLATRSPPAVPSAARRRRTPPACSTTACCEQLSARAPRAR